MPVNSPPLIVTLKIEEASMAYFNALRKQHFPAHINYLNAHLTLFHNLPSEESSIPTALAALANTNTMKLRVSMVKHIGNGVVYVVQSSALQRLHKKMQVAFKPWLKGKDSQKLWPHITVQNKVTAFKSKQLQVHLMSEFEPFEICAIGFESWHYVKGPWRPIATYPFNKF